MATFTDSSIYTTRAAPCPMICSEHTLHQCLLELGRLRMVPHTPETRPQPTGDVGAWQHWESQFLEAERAAVSSRARSAPRDATAFIAWFEALRETGPGQHDPLFPWLAESADLDQMRWFIEQEIAGEAGFDDLIALTQLHMPVTAKLEMARNYWDEMGRGAEVGMHGPMLSATAAELGIASGDAHHDLVWEALALGNLMMALAYRRDYAFHSIGALGSIELTAPTRVDKVAQGLQRLQVSKHGVMYFSLHASVDIRHSKDWNEEVIFTLVRDRPELATPIAEGALMRLNAGARCFARYRQQFGLHPGQTRLN